MTDISILLFPRHAELCVNYAEVSCKFIFLINAC